MISEQLQNELDQEAKAEAKKLTGRVPIFRMGYEAGHYDGAEVYAIKWQEAEQRTATMAGVIEELMNIAYPNVPVLKKANQILADYNTHKQSLTPKTSTVEQANHEES